MKTEEMICKYEFEKVEPTTINRFGAIQKKEAIKWLELVINSYGKEKSQIEKIKVIKYCVENDYKIPSELMDCFMEILRDEIVSWAGNMSLSTSPKDAFTAIDDTKLYSNMYYTYK